MESVFMDKSAIPGNGDLKEKLGPTFTLWQSLKKYINDHVPHPLKNGTFRAKTMGGAFA